MSGAQPEVLTTLTSDFGKILDGLHRTKIHGQAHFTTALNVAQLALKHRQNKSQHQRIIMFCCSPLEEEDQKSMVKLAKRMKKNTISVDVVAFGDLEGNQEKVEAFHESIKGSADGSNLAIIPPGPNLLSDSIVATPILAGDGIGGGGQGGGAGGEGGEGGGAGGEGFEFGIDPNTDPELALALRMSMEEEERRRQREQQAEQKPDGEGQKLEPVPEGEEASSSSGPAPSGEGEKKDGDKKDEGGHKMDTA